MTVGKTRLLVTVLACVLVLTGCGGKAATWQEQYDLGIKYLEDGSYEEAIVAFEAAIEIDPKQAPAYLGLAEVYIAQNDFDKAAEILQQGIDATGDESLQKRLEEINSGNISDYWGNQRKCSGFDANGVLQWYHLMDYEDGRETRCTRYDAAGTQIGQVEVLYDAQGRCTKSISYQADGTVTEYCDFEYDGQGRCTKETWYDPDGTTTGYLVHEYDTQGNCTKSTSCNADGTVQNVTTYD